MCDGKMGDAAEHIDQVVAVVKDIEAVAQVLDHGHGGHIGLVDDADAGALHMMTVGPPPPCVKPDITLRDARLDAARWHPGFLAKKRRQFVRPILKIMREIGVGRLPFVGCEAFRTPNVEQQRSRCGAKAYIEVLGGDRLGASIYAQSPRLVECCAVLGRRPVWRGDCDPRAAKPSQSLRPLQALTSASQDLPAKDAFNSL